jgi:hypothetical protein
MSSNPLAWFRRGKKSKKQPDSPLKKRRTFKPDFEILELRQPAADTVGMAISHGALLSSGALLLSERLAQPELELSHVRTLAMGALPSPLMGEGLGVRAGSMAVVPPLTHETQPDSSSTTKSEARAEPIIVQASPTGDPLATSAAFSAVNAFARFADDPFALFLGPPAIPAKIASSQGGGFDQAAGRNSGGGGSSAGSGATTAIGGSPLVDSTAPILAGANMPISSGASSVAPPGAPAISGGSVSQSGPAAAPAAGRAQGPEKPHLHHHDPLYVLDVNKGITINPAVAEQEFSGWSMTLDAQVSGATVSTYSWNVTNAPDASNVTGSATYQLQFAWASFTGSARTDTISITETPTVGSAVTQTLTFSVNSTSSPAYTATPPTTSSTWPSVITPDTVKPDQETAAGGKFNPTACT